MLTILTDYYSFIRITSFNQFESLLSKLSHAQKYDSLIERREKIIGEAVWFPHLHPFSSCSTDGILRDRLHRAAIFFVTYSISSDDLIGTLKKRMALWRDRLFRLLLIKYRNW